MAGPICVMRSMTMCALLAAAACGGSEPARGAAATSAREPAPLALPPLARHSLTGSSLPRIELLASPNGRASFARVVACALPAGAALTVITADGTPFSFPGDRGLAPGWADRPATTDEQRLVEGCLHGVTA